MSDTIGYNRYINRSPDNEIWRPITQSEHNYFLSLIHEARDKLAHGTKKEKGDALEALMTFIYSKFDEIAEIKPNVSAGDNQIDHIVHFVDGMTPLFINEKIGSRLVCESKNHKKTISGREVADLAELLRSKEAKVGIFSSAKSFSKGLNKSPWINAEGKRRKFAIAKKGIILGFTIDELETLTEKNFYTMLKQKYYSLIDEIDDDVTEYEHTDPVQTYGQRLHDSLLQLSKIGVISNESYNSGKAAIEDKYGEIEY
ncbi:hypothetical protein [Terribacillus saccharophilus]|uniref:hypothetical protein n=1 Tax=Terribacillus saccharophilus TaxID=361277 RepID=UPI002DC37078|nr:hypothetical protein [Terribacillus saccharophilus]